MTRTRLEAFSDGVIAILITIMVLELKAPHGQDWRALEPLVPTFLSYVLSFVYLGIYWSNHHHLFQVVPRVTGGILLANLHLLFWLSLVPFVTAWMGENHNAPGPTAAYGAVMLAAALSFTLLTMTIVRTQGAHSPLKAAVGRDRKSQVSLLLYALSIPAAFVNQWIADAIFVLVACAWLLPDRRIEAVASE
ncbi:MAG: TMEM175 family protein [Vicinamibacterales bacterium]